MLDRLVRVPSVAAQGVGLPETAALVRELFVEAGGRAEIYSRANAAPVVVGEFAGRSDRALLFYNHYDVQPAEPLDEWSAPPFEVTVRNGRILGRGTSDNKGDLVTRLAALRALRDTAGGLPCRVLFLVEGEEEIGSVNLPPYIHALRERLDADACIWEYGDRMKTVLPRRARAKIDFRLVPEQEPQEIVALLRAHLDREGFRDCAITAMGGERAFQTDLADPFVQTVVEAARGATGRRVALVPTSAGTGPMHAIGEPLGIPILSIGAGYWGCNAHAPDEHIRVADFEETIVLIAHVLERFAA